MVRINWITLTAKYSGTCLVNGDPVRVGEKVEWCKGIGVRHVSCGIKADQVEELKQKSFEAILHGNVDASSGFAKMALNIQTNEKELYNLAQSLFDNLDFEGAIILYDKILAKNPNHIGALMSKAAALRYRGKYKKSMRIYNKIIKIQPKHIDALCSQAYMYIYRIKEHKKAIPILKKILKISSKPDDVVDCAHKFAACGEYELAIKLANQALDKYPDIIGARMSKLNWLGSLMEEQKTEKDALAIINKYLKNDPKFFVYLLKYRFYVRAEKNDSAREVYQRMLVEEPETDVDRVIKSNTLAMGKEHDVTIKFCDDNKDRDEIFTHLQITKAIAYKNQGKLVKALEIFRQIELFNDALGSTDTYVLREMASIWEELGNEKNALIYYKKILRFAIDDRETLVKVIHLLKKSHKTDLRLFSYLERLHRLWPDNNNFTMEYANALMEKNEYPKAYDLYAQINEQYDLSDETYDDAKIATLKMGECKLKMGDPKTAYKMFLELVKDDKKFKEAWDGLAIAAMELGKRSEAEKAIKKAANLEKYEFTRDTIEPERIEGMPLAPISPKGTRERSLSKGQNVVQKPTFKYNPKTKMADKGVEKTFVDNIDSLLNVDGGTIQIGFTDGKPTGLFNDLKLFPKKQRNHEEFEKKLRETLQNRLTDSNIWRDIRITFPKTHSVIVCEMFIPKSSIPIWVVTKNKDEEFYVRLKKELVRLTPKEQKEYIDDHFFDVE